MSGIEGGSPLPDRQPPTSGVWVDEVYLGQLGGPTKFGVQATRKLTERQSRYQKIEVFETAPTGRILLLDGCYMTETRFEHYYHEMLAHPALCAAHAIERVLIIGGGDGGTAREVLRHPEVKHVTLCEIDEGVTLTAKEHLSEMRVPWNDPRLEVIHEDGAAFVSSALFPTTPRYDVIIVDGADPEGEAKALFSEGFYRDCKRHLKPWSGVLVTQTLSPIVQRGHFLDAGRNLLKTFGYADPYFGPMPIYPGGTWSYVVATDHGHLRSFSLRRARLAAIDAQCKHYNEEIHRAAFAQPNDIRVAWRAVEAEVQAAKR